jgi:hypothetical protein
MATQIGLGVQFTANASGMTKGLSQVDRQLQRLGQQASGAASLFDSFTRSSEAAVAAQQKVATDLAFLNSAFRTGQVSAEQYAAELKTIVNDANASAAAFAEGARVTQQVATAEEKRAATLARLSDLLQQGAISQQTYERAAADASGANEAAAKAEADRASALARAAQITQANLSPQQKYDQEVLELNQHLAAGRITQDTYNAALQRSAQSFAKATVAAARYDAAADAAGSGNTLAFNELTGLLSALPGPIGNVAGRLSGLSSAAEGLNRVFSGAGGGLQAFAGQIATLVNPTTLAIGAFTAFTAAGVAVAKNLVALEGEVERLGQLAERVGVSFQFIQVLDAAAKASGSSVESLGGAFNKFLRSLGDARNGSKAAADAFRTLGISSDDLQTKSPEELFRQMARAISGITDPADRASVAMDLFGKSGTELLPIFASLDQAAADLERIGGAITDKQAEQIKRFGDELDRAALASQGASNQITASFANAAANVTGGANVILESITKLTSAFPDLGQAAADAIVQQIPGLNVLQFFGQLRDLLGGVEVAATEVQAEIRSIEPPEGFETFVDQISQTQSLLNDAIAESAAFGQAGFEAAYQFQEALKRLQEQAANGILNETAYKQEVETATAAYRSQIDTIKDAAKEEERKAEAARRSAEAAIEADQRRVDSAIDRQRVENEFGGDNRRAEAAETVLAIEREIIRVQEELAAARAANDQAAADAAAARLAQLDQAEARERDIATGAAKAREEAEKVAAKAADDRLRQEEEQQRKIADLRERLAERLQEIEADRLDALSRRSQQALEGNDIRTSAGASQFLALATGREDPAVDEYRKQLRELQEIRREIVKANAAPVEIAG